MILRGTSLSEKSLPLPGIRLERAAPEAKKANPVGPDKPPLPPPLTADAVLAWLDKSNPETRARLTAHLAEDLELLKTTSQQEGFEAGYARGLAQAQERTKAAAVLLQSVVQNVETSLVEESTQLGEQCAEVILEAFTRVAGVPLASREAVLGSVLQVIKRVQSEGEIVIKVGAADLPLLEEVREVISQAVSHRSFSLQVDSGVRLGGCIVESRLGRLDGRLEVQLQALCEAIRDAKTAAGVEP